MTVDPLTKDEKAWLKKLQKVLNECPSTRLGAYTIGDADLTIYDKDEFELYRADNQNDERDDIFIHQDAGTVLHTITMPFQVDGVCG